MILESEFEIVRQDGNEKLSNGELANKLKCSIRPIYYQFENVYFFHGIATLVANNTIKLTDDQIQQLPSYEFQSLMLLEENPNNKWVLPK